MFTLNFQFNLAIALLVSCSAGWSQESFEESFHHTLRLPIGRGTDVLNSLQYSPDGSVLAVAQGNSTKLVDVVRGEIIQSIPCGGRRVQFSANGNEVVVNNLLNVGIYDRKLRSLRRHSMGGNGGLLGMQVERKNGKLLIATIAEGGPADNCGELSIGDELLSVDHGELFRAEKLIGASLQRAYEMFQGPAGTCVRLRVMPRGKFADADIKTVDVQRWEARVNGREIAYIEPQLERHLGKLICTYDNKQFKFYLQGSGKLLGAILSKNRSDHDFRLSFNQRKLVELHGNGRNVVNVYNVETRELLGSVPLKESHFFQLQLLPNSNIVAASNGRRLVLVDIDKLEIVQQKVNGEIAAHQNIDQHSRSYGSGGAGSVVGSVGDAIAHTSQQFGFECFDVAGDREVAIGGIDGKIYIRSLQSGQNIAILNSGTNRRIDAIKFSPNGNSLAYSVNGILHVVGCEAASKQFSQK